MQRFRVPAHFQQQTRTRTRLRLRRVQASNGLRRSRPRSTASLPEKDRLAVAAPPVDASVSRLCEELGIGFVPWSPLGVAFLTGAIDAATRFAPGDIRAAESRFAPENLPHNLALVEVVKTFADRKQATPAQIALAWLMAQKPWIVPIPGTTQMAHMLDNIGASEVSFTPPELSELNESVSAIDIQGQRLPDPILLATGVEAPPKN